MRSAVCKFVLCSLTKKRAFFTVLIIFSAAVQSVFANFILVDDFENLDDGNVSNRAGWECSTTNFTVESSLPGTSSKVLLVGPDLGKYASKRIEPIKDGAAGTLYLEFYCFNLACNVSMGLADGYDGSIWDDYRAQITFSESGAFTVRNGGGFVTLDQNGSMEAGTWYSLWVVADNSNNAYQAYIKGAYLRNRLC